jgi:hypothetical protein
MVVLCAVAIFAMSATTLVIASPASASCNTECKEQKEKEKQEAREQKAKEKEEAREKAKEEAKKQKEQEKAKKEGAEGKYGVRTWGQYKYCPWESPETQFCYAGITEGGRQGGFFEYGKVKVPLSKPIVLQGGYKEVELEEEIEELQLLPANGAASLEAPNLPVTGGIRLFTPRSQEDEQWPTALSESWKEATKNHESAVYVKIELAGTQCFEDITSPGEACLNTTNLLVEHGTAFKLPLKVKVTAPWLEKLGSGPCYIGSDEHPIHINLTSGGPGSAGILEHNPPFTQVVFRQSRLADVGWTIEPESRPTGCGGAYESYIDRALNGLLEDTTAGKTGLVVLKGSLFTAKGGNGVRTEGVESGEL